MAEALWTSSSQFKIPECCCKNSLGSICRPRARHFSNLVAEKKVSTHFVSFRHRTSRPKNRPKMKSFSWKFWWKLISRKKKNYYPNLLFVKSGLRVHFEGWEVPGRVKRKMALLLERLAFPSPQKYLILIFLDLSWNNLVWNECLSWKNNNKKHFQKISKSDFFFAKCINSS